MGSDALGQDPRAYIGVDARVFELLFGDAVWFQFWQTPVIDLHVTNIDRAVFVGVYGVWVSV